MIDKRTRKLVIRQPLWARLAARKAMRLAICDRTFVSLGRAILEGHREGIPRAFPIHKQKAASALKHLQTLVASLQKCVFG